MPYGTEFRTALKILFVDDDEGLGALVRIRLAPRGHIVEAVRSGDEALARIARGDVDVVALDHTLVGETGFDILERLGPRGPRPPVVYVTGHADARTALDALRGGADEYVIKDTGPEFFELLTAAIEHVYERWRLKKVRAEQEKLVREARDRAEMLLHEVNHRVANSLALVAGMVRMQASALGDSVAAHALQETQARITAISGVHRRLYMHDKIGLVAMNDYLQFLTAELQGTLHDQEHAHQIVVASDNITVSTDKAVSIGIIVGELATNAFKYAYPSESTGEIRVSLRRVNPLLAELQVEDDGIGYDDSTGARGTGLGSKILKSMAVTLRADIIRNRRDKGASISIRFPLDPPEIDETPPTQ